VVRDFICSCVGDFSSYYYQEFKLIRLLTGYKMLFRHLGFRIDSSGYIWCYCFGVCEAYCKIYGVYCPYYGYRIYLIVLVIIAIDFDQLPVL
jgi:hypothetical protein